MAEALMITVLGIGIVFAVLLILCGVIYIFEGVFGREKKVKEPVLEKLTEKTEENAELKDNSELVAVIMAALCASLNQSTYNLKIKSIKRAAKSAPAWNMMGRRESLEQRF